MCRMMSRVLCKISIINDHFIWISTSPFFFQMYFKSQISESTFNIIRRLWVHFDRLIEQFLNVQIYKGSNKMVRTTNDVSNGTWCSSLKQKKIYTYEKSGFILLVMQSANRLTISVLRCEHQLNKEFFVSPPNYGRFWWFFISGVDQISRVLCW